MPVDFFRKFHGIFEKVCSLFWQEEDGLTRNPKTGNIPLRWEPRVSLELVGAGGGSSMAWEAGTSRATPAWWPTPCVVAGTLPPLPGSPVTLSVPWGLFHLWTQRALPLNPGLTAWGL